MKNKIKLINSHKKI